MTGHHRPPADGAGTASRSPSEAPAVAATGSPTGSPTGIPVGIPTAIAPVAPEILLARAYLCRVAEPPAPALAALVAEVGPVEAAERVRAGRVADRVAVETSSRRTAYRPDHDLAAAEAAGIRLLTPEHPEWPTAAFAAFHGAAVPDLTAPIALWARGPGDLDELSRHALAMVGTRSATAYGLHMTADLAGGTADRGWTVVSGAAIGIDGAAHRGALAVDGATVAVLACGLDRAYPAAHETLLERIAATGLVVSEYPPACVPGRHRFLVRNRIIAGLGAGTVVVECGLRSGAHRTATDTVALGRDVLAVPGPVTSAVSAGCHRLIREGAVLVTRAEEVLEAVGRLGADLAEPLGAGDRRATDGLDPVAAMVHDALPIRAARDTRWLALESGVPIGPVRSALVELERLGLVQHFAGRWQRSPSRADR